MAHRMVDCMFKSRTTGRITIAQFPNLALGLFLVATIVRIVLKPSGTTGTVLSVVGTGALLLWALDEVVRGVNPWRRLLGGGTLAWEAVQLLAR